MADETEELGSRIRRRRRELDLTQAELAERIGVVEGTVIRYESDQINIPQSRLRQIAKALEWTLSMLVEAPQHRVGAEATAAYEALPYTPDSKRKLTPRSLAIVYGYLERMRVAGAAPEQITAAKQLLIEQGAFNQLDVRAPEERAEDEMIAAIDYAWDFVMSLLRRQGLRL